MAYQTGPSRIGRLGKRWSSVLTTVGRCPLMLVCWPRVLLFAFLSCALVLQKSGVSHFRLHLSYLKRRGIFLHIAVCRVSVCCTAAVDTQECHGN